GVLAALGEVAEPVLALLLLDQGSLAGAETVRSVELHRLTISEDNRLTGVELGSAVGVPVENIEPTGTIHGRDPGAGEAEDFLQHRLENHPFDLRQEPLGRNLLAAGVLDPLESGERPQACPDGRDDQVGTEDAFRPECTDSFANDSLQLGADLVFIGSSRGAFTLAGDEEDARGEGGRVLSTNAARFLCVKRPGLCDCELGSPQCINKS